MAKIKTIKGVPIPPQVGRGGVRARKYPFDTMSVGDCIELFSKQELANARNAAYREKQRNSLFNYGAVEYPDNVTEWERDEDGDEIPGGRQVIGRLWRVEPE